MQRNERISPKEIDAMYEKLLKAINTQMAALQRTVEQQKIIEEQERLRQIQSEMESVKRKKLEEERLRSEEEEKRKQKADIEARRKIESEQRRLEEQSKSPSPISQLDTEEEARYKNLLEQERRDHELAVKLAKESNGQVDECTLTVRRLSNQNIDPSGNKNYDLSKWRYTLLRDTINTSCDIELLEVSAVFFLVKNGVLKKGFFSF